MMSSMVGMALYRANQVREIDRTAIETLGIPGILLMERAGRAAFAHLRRYWPDAKHVGIVCGPGNNGGDGYVVARRLLESGRAVTLLQVGDEDHVRGDALLAREQALRLGLVPRRWHGERLAEFDVVVDALLGTGVRGTLEGIWAEAVAAINASGAPVLALDLPSGLSADTGAPLGVAVRAEMTVTFVALKQGLFTGRAPDYCGRIVLEKLALPDAAYEKVQPSARLMTGKVSFPRRERTVHKGDCGHLLVVGGDYGMSGAVRLAGEAALRCGAGLVSLATRREHAFGLIQSRPELMCHGVQQAEGLTPLLQRVDAVVIGPGLGRDEWGRTLFGRVLDSGLPLVVDADALNLLADCSMVRQDWILTPHPGEASRLLGEAIAVIQADRFSAIRRLQKRYGGVCILKGAGTLVLGSEGEPVVCGAGNPGMASGGMGDVLSGVIGGLLVQGFAFREAAERGVLVHALAGDRAAAVSGERGMLASDLIPHLRKLVNE